MLIFSILFSLFRNILNAAKTDEEAVFACFLRPPLFPIVFVVNFWYFSLNAGYLFISKTY